MPKVLVCQGFMYRRHDRYVDILSAAGLEIVYPEPGRRVLGEDELIANLAGIEATIASLELYTPRVLTAAPQLRVIARCGVGFDSVDLAAASRQATLVGYSPGVNSESVAEHTLALMLAVAKDLVENHQTVVGGGFARGPTRPLRGKTLGLVGLGRIGCAVAKRARVFGMRVLAYDPNVNTAAAAESCDALVELPELLAESDYLSLHAPATAETRQLMCRETFAQMKQSAVVINTARGGLVDEEALAAALTSGEIAAAALDVFEREPPRDSPLLSAPNVLFSPHIAGADTQAAADMAAMAAQTIVDVYQGRWPKECLANAEQVTRPWKW